MPQEAKGGARKSRKRGVRVGLSHVDSSGERAKAKMVDVGAKPTTAREATARALVVFPRGLLARVLAEGGPKGPVIEVARVAGIQAAKRTWDWIPMCHPLALDEVALDVRRLDAQTLEVRCRANCHGRTGVEMEAMVGAAACALVVYDMTKALSHEISIERVELLEKSGGKSGRWSRPSAPAAPRQAPAANVRARRAGSEPAAL